MTTRSTQMHDRRRRCRKPCWGSNRLWGLSAPTNSTDDMMVVPTIKTSVVVATASACASNPDVHVLVVRPDRGAAIVSGA